MKTENHIETTRTNRFAVFAGEIEVAVVMAEAEAEMILQALNKHAIRADRPDELCFAI